MKTTQVPADSVYSTMTSVHRGDPQNGGGNSEDPTNIPPSIEVNLFDILGTKNELKLAEVCIKIGLLTT